MFEKRKHPRQPVDLEATVTTDGTAEVFAGRVRDLSIGGTFFTSECRLPFGTKVTIAIAFPAPSGTLQFPAVVRWKGDDGIGLQFGLVGAKETHAIAQAIRTSHDLARRLIRSIGCSRSPLGSRA